MTNDSVLFEGDTKRNHYVVADVIYTGRPARLLYSGNRQAAQSGLALDDKPELLFDYNERFMELARGLKPRRVLVLGGGAFTFPKALIEEFPSIRLDVVELDPELLEIARRYFDFRPSKHTQVYNADGRRYLEDSLETYDLIVADVFMHAAVPPNFQTVGAARSFARHLRPGGVAAQNLIAAYHGERSATLRRQVAALQAAFQNVQIFPAGRSVSLWLPQNLILTAQNGRRDLQTYLRHKMLDPLKTGSDNSLPEY